MKLLATAIIVALVATLSGCITLLGPSSVDRTNEKIIEANRDRLAAYARAMVACGDNAACQVGASLAFAGNLGQQQLMRPETGLDWVRELRLWIDPIDRIVARVDGGGGYSGDRAVNYVRGDGNILLVGNRFSADQQSTTTFSLTPAYTRIYDGGGNRTFTGLQPINDGGLQ